MADCTDADKALLHTTKEKVESAHKRIDETHGMVSLAHNVIHDVKIHLENLSAGQRSIVERNKHADITNTDHRNILYTSIQELIVANDRQDAELSAEREITAEERGARKAREALLNTYGVLFVTVLLGVLGWMFLEIKSIEEDKHNEIVGIKKELKATYRRDKDNEDKGE